MKFADVASLTASYDVRPDVPYDTTRRGAPDALASEP